MAKILRLCKQQDLLRKRQDKMSYQGLCFLNKLDAAKEKEKQDKERVEQERAIVAQQPPYYDDPITSFNPNPSQEGLGFVSKTLQASQGS